MHLGFNVDDWRTLEGVEAPDYEPFPLRFYEFDGRESKGIWAVRAVC
jgi:hypothetical protein